MAELSGEASPKKERRPREKSLRNKSLSDDGVRGVSNQIREKRQFCFVCQSRVVKKN